MTLSSDVTAPVRERRYVMTLGYEPVSIRWWRHRFPVVMFTSNGLTCPSRLRHAVTERLPRRVRDVATIQLTTIRMQQLVANLWRRLNLVHTIGLRQRQSQRFNTVNSLMQERVNDKVTHHMAPRCRVWRQLKRPFTRKVCVCIFLWSLSNSWKSKCQVWPASLVTPFLPPTNEVAGR